MLTNILSVDTDWFLLNNHDSLHPVIRASSALY